MNFRTVAVGTALAIFGLGAAVGIGLAANAISGDSVGLSEEPLSAGESLAPRPAAAEQLRRARAERDQRASDDAPSDDGSPQEPDLEPVEPPEVEPEIESDSSGHGRGRGRGRGRSGGDSGSSDSSGSGSDDD
jgi:hypothetical protein